MAIPRSIAGAFSATVRARGDAYFREGKVQLHPSAAPGEIEATVLGTSPWSVAIRVGSGGRLDVACNCPAARGDQDCKHVWATLLAADKAGALPWSDAAARKAARASRNDPESDGAKRPAWSRQLHSLSVRMTTPPVAGIPPQWPAGHRLAYILDFEATAERAEGLVVEVAVERQKKSGEWSAPTALHLARSTWLSAPEPADREIAHQLLGAQPEWDNGAFPATGRFVVPPSAFDTTLRRILETGRARVGHVAVLEATPITWDHGGPWAFELEIIPRKSRYLLVGSFVRGEERLPVAAPDIIMRGGLLVHERRMSRFLDEGHYELLHALRTEGEISVSAKRLDDFMDELHRLPRLPTLRVPESLGIATVQGEPVPVLEFVPDEQPAWGPRRAEATLAFLYGDVVVDADDPRAAVLDRAARRLVQRAPAAEAKALDTLLASGFRWERGWDDDRPRLRIASGRTLGVATQLMAEGWRVRMQGRTVRVGGELGLDVTSGIDWFDVTGSVDFGTVRANVPELLAAVRAGRDVVPLSDGSLGFLPDELSRRLALLASIGTQAEDAMRYTRAQVGVLDAILADVPEATVDEAFAQLREAVRRFDGITPSDPPEGFVGELRAYQREGLGWLLFLQRLGLGGCLADDMGLGKTVQAIAMLLGRVGQGPSLVVVPNSLVFNWEQELTRFAPGLKVHTHLGARRTREGLRFGHANVVITTYGTLRSDAGALGSVPFDYVILDEAQAIKNAATASARAARGLKARHRLAMTGTPIENRIEELWSLFEFLNPGLLGSSASFTRVLSRRATDDVPDPQGSGREFVARAVRPYLLRRTKEQVAPELPEKLEQTLLVELTAADRRRYDELRDHYRASLMGRIASTGLAKSRVHVLEALLRLRQAACHPGLIKPELAAEGSSKLDVLEASVTEIVAEGHKVLVFSQFTSLLAIVRAAFDRAGLAYAYLDGGTRDRAAVVQRFQEDPACPVFLISLKAGGVGLNLTAADYVFLLDPWWNPAVEAQAIDRTHRIGQSRRVFATRLIARDTVEEKVLQLQERKRDLADAIIRADDGPLASLTREDLELLLT